MLFHYSCMVVVHFVLGPDNLAVKGIYIKTVHLANARPIYILIFSGIHCIAENYLQKWILQQFSTDVYFLTCIAAMHNIILTMLDMPVRIAQWKDVEEVNACNIQWHLLS